MEEKGERNSAYILAFLGAMDNLAVVLTPTESLRTNQAVRRQSSIAGSLNFATPTRCRSHRNWADSDHKHPGT
ncbi:hypothetical protein WOLCODRAFT_27739 [Wolfiporia cocos MD-104 SS10]|uniref:Uncharacterized protein n=1 Tax=Wolfiporia cocos (strain MD-104) TaxID=742152 RepID=A0A2H3JEU6_WOLCO|nr:hypothetical protein WOLCODRAFT_27739 [Wolfiporia cocos MD-104 SS10]